VKTASLNKREAVDLMMCAFTEARFNPVFRTFSLNQARNSYLRTVIGYNRAQFEM
jgi:hypothetical protein